MTAKRRSRLPLLVAIALLLSWVAAVAAGTLLGWGFVGMPKPPWFVVCSYAIWAAPPLVGVTIVASLVIRSARWPRRTS